MSQSPTHTYADHQPSFTSFLHRNLVESHQMQSTGDLDQRSLADIKLDGHQRCQVALCVVVGKVCKRVARVRVVRRAQNVVLVTRILRANIRQCRQHHVAKLSTFYSERGNPRQQILPAVCNSHWALPVCIIEQNLVGISAVMLVVFHQHLGIGLSSARFNVPPNTF